MQVGYRGPRPRARSERGAAASAVTEYHPRREHSQMSRARPRIPRNIARAVLIESGHRCAVCGVPCPLQQAHIVPWRHCGKHSVENLICLCANCHARADSENWGEAVLREYKATPWVHRQNSKHVATSDFDLVEISIRKEIRDFDKHQAEMLRYALAKFLAIDLEAIKVIGKRPGSVRVVLEVPRGLTAELRESLMSGKLQSQLPLFPLAEMEAVISGEMELQDASGETQDELGTMVRKAIEELPDSLRMFLKLDFVERREASEICTHLGIDHRDYLRLKSRAFGALRDKLEVQLNQKE